MKPLQKLIGDQINNSSGRMVDLMRFKYVWADVSLRYEILNQIEYKIDDAP